MRTTLAYLFSLALPLAALTGCGGGDPAGDNAAVSEALDSQDDTSSEGALLMVTTEGTQSALTAGEAATLAVAGAHTWWQPSTCVTTSINLNVVTYTLNNCTGPWGLVHVTGTVVVTYSMASDGIHASASANGLLVNGGTLNLDAQATYSVSGTTKKLTVSTSSTGTGPRGNSLSRQGNYTLTWNTATACGTVDGDWSTTINTYTWSTGIANFAQCLGHCPSSGTLTHTGGISGVTITVTFDGTGWAKWTSSRGRSGTIALFCIP
jgi:hypothetical protein